MDQSKYINFADVRVNEVRNISLSVTSNCYTFCNASSFTTMPFSHVAIAGGTGHLGSNMTSASPGIRVLSTRAGSQYQIDYDNPATILSALEGVTVLICTLPSVAHAQKDKLIRAAFQSPSLKLYIPSEFGVDHYREGHVVHPEWTMKQNHFKLATELSADRVRICRVVNGMFLEDSLGPWFGFETQKGEIRLFGKNDTVLTFTSLGDVGRAVAEIASMRVEDVPEKVYLAGCVMTVQQIADLWDGKVKIVELSEEEKGKAEVAIREGRPYSDKDPALGIQLAMAEGIDFSGKNDNELVNPGESRWKWKTVADYVKETDGKPWWT
jgi:hypothetical protein